MFTSVPILLWETVHACFMSRAIRVEYHIYIHIIIYKSTRVYDCQCARVH